MERTKTPSPKFRRATENFYNKIFYSHLVAPKPGGTKYVKYLKNDFKNINDGNLIIARDKKIKDKDNKDQLIKQYAFFDSYIDFYHWQKNIPESQRNFYEVIFTSYQKPHFDIDINIEDTEGYDHMRTISDYIINNIKSNISWVMMERGLKYLEQNLLLFSSNSDNKRSYHIVLDNFLHSNPAEAEHFYNEVKNRFPDTYKKFIDSAVYKKHQCFRIIGSQKLDSNRPKIYVGIIDNDDKSRMDLLRRSLVSFTNDSKDNIMPNMILINGNNYDDKEITDTESDRAVNKFFELYPEQRKYLSYRDTLGCFISLKRDKPGPCIQCKRNHDNDGSYLTILNNNLFFKCRRSEDMDHLLIQSNFSLDNVTNHINKAINDFQNKNTKKNQIETFSGKIDFSVGDFNYDPYVKFDLIDHLEIHNNVIYPNYNDCIQAVCKTLLQVIRIKIGPRKTYICKVNEKGKFVFSDSLSDYKEYNCFYMAPVEGDTTGIMEKKSMFPFQPLYEKNLAHHFAINNIDCIPYHKNSYKQIPHTINIFPGFKAVKVPITDNDKYKIDIFLNHIKEVWANNNESYYKYILSWLAYPIRNLTFSGICLILCGKGGSGKSVIFEFLTEYVYGNNLAISDGSLDIVTDKFNCILEGKMLVIVNESDSKEGSIKYNTTILKDRITGSTLTVQKKGFDKYTVQNICNYAICTNNDTSIYQDSGGMRRFACFATNDKYANDILDDPITKKRKNDYFDQLWGTIKNQDFGNLLYSYFLSMSDDDLTNIKIIPNTDVRMSNIKMSQTKQAQFISDLLNGDIIIDKIYLHLINNKVLVIKTELYEFFVIYMKTYERISKIVGFETFCRTINLYLSNGERIGVKNTWELTSDQHKKLSIDDPKNH